MIRARLLPSLSLGVALLLSGCEGGAQDEVYTVRRSDLVQTVEATGFLRADETAFVAPPLIPEIWNLKIVWMAPEGRLVRRGEPVLAFDDADLRQDLERIKGEHDQAAKEMEKQELELNTQLLELDGQLGEAEARLRRARLKMEVPGDLVAQVALEKDRLDRDLAGAEVESLKIQKKLLEKSGSAQIEILRRRRDRSAQRVQELEAGIGKMRVAAPREGMVVYVSSWRGEKHKVGDSVYRMERVLEIPDLRRMGAEAEIDEAEAGRIRPGQKVTLRLEAYPDRLISGEVAEISAAIRRQSWNSPLKIRTAGIRLQGTHPEWMRPGMRLRAEFEVKRIVKTLVIPLEAVAPGPDGPVVTDVSSFRSTPIPVKLGERSQSLVEVLTGLEEGQRILRRPGAEDGAESHRGAL